MSDERRRTYQYYRLRAPTARELMATVKAEQDAKDKPHAHEPIEGIHENVTQ